MEDNNLFQHNSGLERVVGYNYDPEKNQINTATWFINKGADTKRCILAQGAKSFDSLSLYVHITVKSKLILRSLWRLNLDWDMKIPNDMQS